MVSPHRVPPARAAAPCSRRGTRLLAVALSLLATACATTSGDLRTDCERGNTGACSTWGTQLLMQGEKQQAENAYARSCEGGELDDCTSQGRLMLERGELTGAEAPLLKGYEYESEAATLALADLYLSRGEPGDAERARQMRWEAPAIDKPGREFIFWWRPSPTGETTYALAYSFQPMAFWARRMTLGLHAAGNSRGGNELNAAIGYQHFLTPAVVPYGTLLLGGAFQQRAFNAGAEVGIKWCLGPVGHLNLGGGISVGSPLHASIGIGINSLPIELLLLLAGR
ncbi:hypothetical protein [Hyalangium sp.]|uniref:hypothetical protein n=1 Tax=Hyalangium sp. TaxID=2028555 RepID=UPI002D50A33A|nr:hypothetical protein [Hyalangium sp.]HYH97481.1 hypothetical protein [Hyalangium sp.]